MYSMHGNRSFSPSIRWCVISAWPLMIPQLGQTTREAQHDNPLLALASAVHFGHRNIVHSRTFPIFIAESISRWVAVLSVGPEYSS